MIWPFRLRTIFRNRWWTMAWVGLVLWSVYDFGSERQATSAPPEATSDTAAPASPPAEEAMVADMMNKVSSIQ